jgi:hypothetical protein
VSAELLERVARALGRARARSRFRKATVPRRDRALANPRGTATPCSAGTCSRAGSTPGPEFARILARCREVQDETGWSDPEAILRRAREVLA